jgi:hypothetical protein
MSTVYLNRLPASCPGQLMLEIRTGNQVRREVRRECNSPKSLSNDHTSVWAGRHGGWVRVA